MSFRHPARRLAPVTLVLALLTLTALAAPAEANSHDELVHMSEWTPGDHWVWKKDPTSARGSRSTGNLTWIVQDVQNLTLDLWEPEDGVQWRTQHTYRVGSWLNTSIPTEQTSIEIRQENIMYRRVADQSLVRSEVNDRYIIDVGNDSAEEGRTVRNFERYAPLLEMQFPFAVGDAWRARTEQRYVDVDSDECGGPDQRSCRGGGPVAFTYEVLGTDRMTFTLNGEDVTLRPHRIKVTDERQGTYEVWWYAQEVCNVVLREQYSVDRQKIGVLTLTDYQCAGGQMADPDYSAWDYLEFSSTRFHGALNDDALKGVKKAPPQRDTLFTPGPGVVLVAVALVGLVAVARRRT